MLTYDEFVVLYGTGDSAIDVDNYVEYVDEMLMYKEEVKHEYKQQD